MARRRALHPAFDALANFRKALDVKNAPPPAPAAPKILPTAAERALFRQAMADVQPLPPANRAEIETPKPKPLPRQRDQDEAAALQETLTGPCSLEDHLDMLATEAGDAFWRPGLPRRTLADLRRGRWIIQSELDLHGYTREEAHEALGAFIVSCLSRGFRCVRIVHGKGISSPGGYSVLKTLSRQWLTRRAEVLAFCAAKPHDGGDGALIVLLRSLKPAGERAADPK
jgi:DNA-nicking Smr family endonuclease